MEWGKITKQPKSKSWITAEYSTLSATLKDSKTILVYEEDDEHKEQCGNWRVWIGKTDGSDIGRYYDVDTKIQALEKAKKLMR